MSIFVLLYTYKYNLFICRLVYLYKLNRKNHAPKGFFQKTICLRRYYALNLECLLNKINTKKLKFLNLKTSFLRKITSV